MGSHSALTPDRDGDGEHWKTGRQGVAQQTKKQEEAGPHAGFYNQLPPVNC